MGDRCIDQDDDADDRGNKTPSYSHRSLQGYNEATFKNWLKHLYNRATGNEKKNVSNYARRCNYTNSLK